MEELAAKEGLPHLQALLDNLARVNPEPAAAFDRLKSAQNSFDQAVCELQKVLAGGLCALRRLEQLCGRLQAEIDTCLQTVGKNLKGDFLENALKMSALRKQVLGAVKDLKSAAEIVEEKLASAKELSCSLHEQL